MFICQKSGKLSKLKGFMKMNKDTSFYKTIASLHLKTSNAFEIFTNAIKHISLKL